MLDKKLYLKCIGLVNAIDWSKKKNCIDWSKKNFHANSNAHYVTPTLTLITLVILSYRPHNHILSAHITIHWGHLTRFAACISHRFAACISPFCCLHISISFAACMFPFPIPFRLALLLAYLIVAGCAVLVTVALLLAYLIALLLVYLLLCCLYISISRLLAYLHFPLQISISLWLHISISLWVHISISLWIACIPPLPFRRYLHFHLVSRLIYFKGLFSWVTSIWDLHFPFVCFLYFI